MAQYSEEWFYPTGALATNQRAVVFGPGDDNAIAPIFSDAGLTTPLPNPTTTSASGILTFYAADGTYWIWVGPTTGGNGIEITLGASPNNPVLSVNSIPPDGGGNVVIGASDVGAQPIATIDALGDLYVGTGPDATARLPIGTAGEVLTVAGGTASWEAAPAGAVSSVNGQTGVVVLTAANVGAQPISTIDAKGDLYAGTADNTTARRSVGINGTVLTADSSDPTGMVWQTPAADAVTSVNGQTGVVVLTAANVGADPAGSAAAAAAASQPLAIIDATGDLYIGTGNNTTTRLPIGTAGEVLTVVAGTASWEASPADAVTSVNGQTGVVVLTSSSVGAQPIATIDAIGDLYIGTGNDATTRLPIGTAGEVLTVTGGTATWEPVPADAVTSVNGQTGVVVLTATSVGADPAGAALAASRHPIVFTDDRNVLTVGAGDARFYNREGVTLTIVGAWVSAGVQPTGAAILVDVNLNGTTIYTTQGNRPTVTAATNGGALSATPDVTSFAQGDYLTVDIDQIGSTIAGGRMTVGIIVQRSA